jgi:hypothetical protein
MRNVFRNCVAVIVLIAFVYFVSNYSGAIQEKVGVKGISTQKAREITGRINSDIQKQVGVAASKAGEIKVSDIVTGLSRFQKIPQDFNAMKEFVQEQVQNFRSKK